MDHADALEQIEIAAVEPDGLERLMAGDTPEAAAVAGHLAGCAACVEELARIRRASTLARQVIASTPDPALRERTLTFVREVGRDRSSGAATGDAEPTPAVLSPAAAPVPRVPHPTARPALRYLGLAAALAIAVGLGAIAAGLLRPPAADEHREVAVLQQTAVAALHVQAQPDAQRVELVATSAGGDATGTLLFSPSTGELVMVAEGLAEPAAGLGYGCWVEAGGERRRIGHMYPGGDLEAWAGVVDGLADLPPDAVFGVSLVPEDGGAGEPMLTGEL